MNDYAKQTQFLKTKNERKPLWKKGLRKKDHTASLSKTNPNKANFPGSHFAIRRKMGSL
jgi:hypothetical protein